MIDCRERRTYLRRSAAASPAADVIPATNFMRSRDDDDSARLRGRQSMPPCGTGLRRRGLSTSGEASRYQHCRQVDDDNIGDSPILLTPAYNISSTPHDSESRMRMPIPLTLTAGAARVATSAMIRLRLRSGHASPVARLLVPGYQYQSWDFDSICCRGASMMPGGQPLHFPRRRVGGDERCVVAAKRVSICFNA